MAWWVAWVSVAHAADVPETTGTVQLLRASVDGTHTQWTDDAGRRATGTLAARTMASWTHRPLVYDVGGSVRSVVGSVWQLDVLGAATLGPVRIGVDVPVLATGRSDVFTGAAGLGDLALDGKVTVLDPASGSAGVAVASRVVLPTGTVRRALARTSPELELSAIGETTVADFVHLMANAGVRFGAPLTLGDTVIGAQVVGRGAVVVPLGDRAGVSAELAARLPLQGPLRLGAPAELLVGGWFGLDEAWSLRGGIGRGITGAAGAPIARAQLGVAFEPPRRPKRPVANPVPQRPERPGDSDQDGLDDAFDDCPDRPEDQDGYLDSDGCPDPIAFVVRVQDARGAVVPGAFAWLQCDEKEARLTADAAVEMPAGPCSLTVAAPGWSAVNDQVLELMEGPPVERVVQLTPEGPVAHVRVQVKDDAGNPLHAAWTVGQNPARFPLRQGRGALVLAPGTHVLTFSRPGFEPESTEVTLEAGEEVELDVLLVPKATER